MSRQNEIPHFYYCVHCLQSCPSLYRTLGKGDSVIKLSPCESCGKPAVDPYCEREWLLVILDLVLLRQAAYRHVLWNRGRLLALQPAPSAPTLPRASIAKTTTCTSISSSSSSNNNALYDHTPRSLLTAALLRAHIGMVSTQDRVDADHTPSAAWEFLQLATISVVGYSAQIATTAVLVNYLTAWIGQPQQEQRQNRSHLWNVAALSVLLPTAGQIVTAFALLWENSHAVLSVGSLLLLVHQWMALFTLTEVFIIQQQKTRKSRYIWLAQSCTTTLLLLLSLLVRGVGMILVGKVVAAAAGATTPCPGLGWKHDNLLRLGRNTLCLA